MAKNIFSMFQGYVPKPKRNVFDLSFNNNFTTKFGQLTPVLCKEVVPGDSFKIETAAGLRLMPMAFPVQTPMKAYVHYFYVRNRALWKDWQDFITGTKDNLVPPYIDLDNYTSDEKKEFFKIGGIADYFGVPNVFYGDFARTYNSEIVCEKYTFDDVNISASHPIDVYAGFSRRFKPSVAPYLSWYNRHNWTMEQHLSYLQTLSSNIEGQNIDDITEVGPSDYKTELESINNTSSITSEMKVGPLFLLGEFDLRLSLLRDANVTFKGTAGFYNPEGQIIRDDYPLAVVFLDSDRNVLKVALTSVTFNRDVQDVDQFDGEVNLPLLALGLDTELVKSVQFYAFPYIGTSGTSIYVNSRSNLDRYTFSIDVEFFQNGQLVVGSEDLLQSPYDSDIPLSALPFRAYECIYNSYYRNMQNNPYILNGVEEYNKFIPSNDGGADSNSYHLHQRNWEYDFLTSAVPSPQFGVAPLVGITMTGTATFQDENGTTYYAQAELDDDGTITGWSTHSSNMPAGTLRMLMDNVGTGISINDLRNVNSFQRFLENSLRVGLKYRDQIKGHFGVDVRYDELEMPEFIGGMSLDINVNQVTQTADVMDSSYPLAGFAGQAGAFGSSKHAVTKYCDEHGFIIGILSVVPVPVYSQLLPKFFTKNEMLDYYYPEFGHIGYQPILQKEVSPLQSFYSGSDLNDVFGYQRAWYDYIASTDEVHAQFRTTLRDFVMNRTFESVPALNESFLLVDPEQVNDVFLVTSDGEYGPEADKILGQLYFKITKKSPIPILGIPRLTD